MKQTDQAIVRRVMAVVALLAGVPAAALAQERVGEGVPAFQVRPGYRVTLAAKDLGEARFIEFGKDGELFLSQPRRGAIVRLVDKDGDGVFESKSDFVTDRPTAHGMFYKDGWLYFSQAGKGSVTRARDDDGDGKAEKVEPVVPDGGLPSGGGHPFIGLLVTDDALYATISDPRNMTPELESDRKTLYRFSPDGKNRTVFASGIRNTEKLRVRPGTSEIYGFDHGSDNFGQRYGDTPGKDQPITDLIPPEELNLFVEGGFYGHPYLLGNRVPRPEHTDRKDFHELARRTIPPAWSLGAHWAINGFTFLSGDYFPGHKGDIFCAAHGSWNSQKRVGYCVERVLFDPETGKPYGSLTIVSTLGKDGREVLARPVDCAEAPDGTVLFSSDHTRAIYRISKAQ